MAELRKQVICRAWKVFLKNFYSIKEVKPSSYKRLRIFGIPVRKIRKKKTPSPVSKPDYDGMSIQQNKIIFSSVLGGYSCNPKYITEEIIRQKLPYELVWVVGDNLIKCIRDFPKDVHLVAHGSPEAFREYATAKVRVENTIRADKKDPVTNGLYKKDGQFHIQTWHGSLGFKRVTIENSRPRSQKTYTSHLKDIREYDYIISNAEWESNIFRRVFWDHGRIIEVGHPRNDVLFQRDLENIRKEVFASLKLSTDKKLILYAPTWRNNKKMPDPPLDYTLLISAVQKRFGGEWVLAVRAHHEMILHHGSFEISGEDIVDASDYPDIQRLMSVSDIMITDYSSCVLDFMFTRRPGFLYAPDREQYEKEIGLYYPLSEAPFPIAESNEDMVRIIEEFDETGYKNRVEEFIAGKGCIEDGHAAERVVELIKKLAPLESIQA